VEHRRALLVTGLIFIDRLRRLGLPGAGRLGTPGGGAAVFGLMNLFKNAIPLIRVPAAPENEDRQGDKAQRAHAHKTGSAVKKHHGHGVVFLG